MASGHRDLAYPLSGRAAPLTLVLPLSEARERARAIIGQHGESPYLAVVENWQQRSDGQIEFTVRAIVASD